VTPLARVVRTTAFKLSAIYIAVFSIFSVFFVLYIAYSTNVLLSQQVRDTIATNPAGLTADAVTRLVGAKHDTVTRTLRRLENANDIQRVGDLFFPLDAPY